VQPPTAAATIMFISNARPERPHIGDRDPAIVAGRPRPIVLGAWFLDISKRNPTISEVEINGLRNTEIFNVSSIST
jgi:hypothetical protein